MKALAWYTVILNVLLVLLFVLLAVGAVEKPPLSALEDILWAVFTVPVVIFGILVLRKGK